MRGAHRLFVLTLFAMMVAAPVQADPADRLVPLSGQMGPYWEQQGLHVGGNTMAGSVPLHVDESLARVHLAVDDRSVGSSAGYLVQFCSEPCGLNRGDGTIASATGMGPFDMAFSVEGLDAVHYRVSVDEGVRVDVHVTGSLVLSGVGDEESEPATVEQATPREPISSSSSIALGLGALGIVALAPAVFTRLSRWLGPAPLVGLFTRRETLLDHPVRKRLHEKIHEVPGIHLRELRRAMEMPPGQVDHHLQKLIEGGYVVTHAVRGYTAHFVPGTVDRKLMAALARVKSDAARSLLSHLAEGKDLTLGGIAERMGIAISTASYHAGSLERLGLVEVRANGTRRWRVTSLGRAFLDLVGPEPGSTSRNGPESA